MADKFPGLLNDEATSVQLAEKTANGFRRIDRCVWTEDTETCVSVACDMASGLILLRKDTYAGTSRLSGKAMHVGASVTRMTRDEARAVGARLIVLADQDWPGSPSSPSEGSGKDPNTSAITSSAPVITDGAVPSESNVRVSKSDFSAALRTASFVAVLRSSSAVLLRCISRSVRRIASTARCWPRARNAGSNSSILSSMVSGKSHGSRPGEAVELRAHGFTRVRSFAAPTEGAAA